MSRPRSTAEAAHPRHPLGLVFLFTLTLFLSAFLLFSVQPIFAKMILPLLGGTPAVWNTCLLFFQAMLLAGYAYAHGTTQWLGARRQTLLHATVLLLPLLTLPIGLPAGWHPPVDANPVPWLLGLLCCGVGLPFVVVATSAPLVQQWFAQTRHPAAKDPYFLYAASNLGSLLALLSYPVLVEPHLPLSRQGWWWAIGYAWYVLMIMGCAACVWRAASSIATPEASRRPVSTTSKERIAGNRRLRWVLLSFVPSSLLLGVTTYISTDIAAIPLLWVVPLAIYLLTFIFVFARLVVVPHALLVNLLPIPLLTLALLMTCGIKEPLWLLLTVHVLTLFMAAMVCHGELAQDRPAATHLTEFYVWLSVGGVLGGLFNALVAPQIFDGVVEYPLALVLVGLLRPGTRAPARQPVNRFDYLMPLGLGLLLATFCLAVPRLSIASEHVRIVLTYGPAILFCFLFRYRPIRFGLGVGVFLLVGAWASTNWQHLLNVQRSFFGVYRITEERTLSGRYHKLQHGTTLHGMQNLQPALRHEPLTYYARRGPIGQVLAARPVGTVPAQMAVIGLGTGTMAAYAGPDRRVTFYEIDPLVQRLAATPRYFTHLSDCGDRCRVVLGDARRSLVQAPDRFYDVIALDAFSSDSIPVHLLTQEALQLYLRKLADGGVIALHISNRYLDLEPVLGHLAAQMGLACLVAKHVVRQGAEMAGVLSSNWVVIARRAGDVGALATDKRWRSPSTTDGPVWTDDYSNLLSVMRWR